MCVCIHQHLFKRGKKPQQQSEPHSVCILITASDSPRCLSALINAPFEANCLSQKWISPCLHSESRHQNIQLTQGLCVCMGILKQLITTESTEQKGKDIIIFTPSRESVYCEREKLETYCAIWIWMIFIHLTYSLDSKYLFEAKLKYFSSVLSEFIEIFNMFQTERYWYTVCERCSTLKRH